VGGVEEEKGEFLRQGLLVGVVNALGFLVSEFIFKGLKSTTTRNLAGQQSDKDPIGRNNPTACRSCPTIQAVVACKFLFPRRQAKFSQASLSLCFVYLLEQTPASPLVRFPQCRSSFLEYRCNDDAFHSFVDCSAPSAYRLILKRVVVVAVEGVEAVCAPARATLARPQSAPHSEIKTTMCRHRGIGRRFTHVTGCGLDGARVRLLATDFRCWRCHRGPASLAQVPGPETLVRACASDAGAQSRRFEACSRSLHPHTALQDLVKLESTVPSFRFRMKKQPCGQREDPISRSAPGNRPQGAWPWDGRRDWLPGRVSRRLTVRQGWRDSKPGGERTQSRV